ncbi:MAG: hypothetical protein WC611_08885, partial [Candidatus Neomarinimicrobiota bacterium]
GLESAEIIAQALELLNDLIFFAHNNKLTRQQHIQFLLSDIITYTETAVALSHKTAEHLRTSAPDASKLQSALRIFVAEMAWLVSNKGMEIIMGCETVDDATKKEYLEKLHNLDLVKMELNIINEMDNILE